jgi:hypothetical protein
MSGASFSSNDLLLRSFARSLRARNRSPKTISGYLEAARLLCDHVGDRDLLELTRGDIQDFIAEQLEHHRPTTAAVRFRSLQQLYRWAGEEELITVSPMTGMKPPSIPEEPVAILDEPTLVRLLGSMNSRGFEIGGTPPSSGSSWTRACARPRWPASARAISILIRMSRSCWARVVVPVPVPSATRQVPPPSRRASDGTANTTPSAWLQRPCPTISQDAQSVSASANSRRVSRRSGMSEPATIGFSTLTVT